MNYNISNLIKGMGLGFIAGIIWGLISVIINLASGIFTFENNITHNILTFSVGGGILGVIIGGIMIITCKLLPFKNIIIKAVLVSSSLWSALYIGSLLLSFLNPDRYHPDMPQALQGLLLSVLLGSIFGTLWNLEHKKI